MKISLRPDLAVAEHGFLPSESVPPRVGGTDLPDVCYCVADDAAVQMLELWTMMNTGKCHFHCVENSNR